jgi:hypothetical protein
MWVLGGLAIAVAAVLGVTSWLTMRGPGDPPAASGVTVDLVLEPTQVKTFVREHDGSHSGITLSAPQTSQIVAGTITVPPDTALSDQDYYALFVIDETDDDVALDVYGLPSKGSGLTRGWDGRYNELAEEYPWLASVASTETGSGWTDPGTTLAFESDALNRPLQFAAWLQPGGSLLDKPAQLTIALAAWDDDGDLAWAVPLGQPEPTN